MHAFVVSLIKLDGNLFKCKFVFVFAFVFMYSLVDGKANVTPFWFTVVGVQLPATGLTCIH